MSAIWENDDVKEKIMLLPPTMQEAFLRAVDSLYQKESSYMLTFIKESRDELRGTHEDIVKEQEVLRDTSDLLASKRMYGDPDDWKDTSYDTNAVDDYLKRRNQGDLSGLGILSFEDERKPHKKHKKKDKEREHSKKHDASDILDKHKKKKKSYEIETHGAELIGEVEIIAKEKPKDKEKKEKKDKKEKSKDKERDETLEKREKDVSRSKEKHSKNKKKEQFDDIESLPARPERERSAVSILLREKTDIETIQQETQELMTEFLHRQSGNDDRAQQEQAMMRKLAKKKNPLAFEADELLKQQRAADIARDQEKRAYEAKMMEKLRMRREQSNLSKELSSLDEPGDAEKHKKEKKRKNKDKDKEAAEDEKPHKEEKKKKKKKEKKDVEV